MLTIISTHEVALSKAAQGRVWEAFMRGGTTHNPRPTLVTVSTDASAFPNWFF